MICVGKCPKLDSYLFYHPDSKVLVSGADGHQFDNYSPSGPQSGLQYDGGSRLQESQTKKSIKNQFTK